MRRLRLVILILLMMTGTCFYVMAQDAAEIMQAYQRNFVRGNLTTKVQVLQDASNNKTVDMGPLYQLALKFVIENARIFDNDPTFQQLAVLSIRLVGLSGYRESIDQLWQLFSIDSTAAIRVEVLNALASFSPPDSTVVQNINTWLSAQNSMFAAGRTVDVTVVSEAIVALGRMGEASSFPVLFTAHTEGYSEDITRKAQDALYSIKGSFKDLILKVIQSNPPRDKLAALRVAISNDSLTSQDKGAIAAEALHVGLNTTAQSSDAKEYLRQIRYEAVRVLTAQKWSAATDDVIEHFNRTLQELNLGIGRVSYVLEAIACLGAMGTHKAAVRLTAYLDILNSDVENGKKVDESIVLAVMQNLGLLADKDSFDQLLYAGYLNYSEKVKKAAKEAINKLPL